jgi:transcriptional regulator with XRE-family HTH domain
LESKTQTNQNIISAVRELRHTLGLTQQQLAVALGLAVVTVARWETSRLPSTDALINLSNFAYDHNLFGLARRFFALVRAGDSSDMEEAYRFFDEIDIAQTYMDSQLRRALVLVLRNQHLPTLRDDWRQIRDAILMALYRLSAAAQAGDNVQGSPTKIMELIDSIESWATADLSTGLSMTREKLEDRPTMRGSPTDQPPKRPRKRSK